MKQKPTEILPAHIPEDAFQQEVIQLARLLGYRVAHFRGVRIQRKNGSVYWQTPVQADGKGFVDLVMVRTDPKRTIFAELKSDKGVLSPEQKEWLKVLAVAGNEVYVWKPQEWDEIKGILFQSETPTEAQSKAMGR